MFHPNEVPRSKMIDFAEGITMNHHFLRHKKWYAILSAQGDSMFSAQQTHQKSRLPVQLFRGHRIVALDRLSVKPTAGSIRIQLKMCHAVPTQKERSQRAMCNATFS